MSDQVKVGECGRRLDDLSYSECMRRLATKNLGRLAVIIDNYPQVFPVNYGLDGEIVVFRTHIGSRLLSAHHANIGFQVDEIDPGSRSGWSVVIQGMAEDVSDRAGDPIAERSRGLDVRPWAPGDKPRVIRIIPAHVSGQELTSGDLLFWTDDRAYL